jgi:hypothetical protein
MTSDVVFVNTVIGSWKQVVERLDKKIQPLSEEQLQQRVAPERNRLRYLVGHLTAVHDRMFPLLGLGERLHPELDEAYVTNPDGTLADPISVEDLKKAWSDVNAKVTAVVEALTAEEWLQKHTRVSDEDFAKDPSRNRLSVFLSRTNHASGHLGQMALVK